MVARLPEWLAQIERGRCTVSAGCSRTGEIAERTPWILSRDEVCGVQAWPLGCWTLGSMTWTEGFPIGLLVEVHRVLQRRYPSEENVELLPLPYMS